MNALLKTAPTDGTQDWMFEWPPIEFANDPTRRQTPLELPNLSAPCGMNPDNARWHTAWREALNRLFDNIGLERT